MKEQEEEEEEERRFKGKRMRKADVDGIDVVDEVDEKEVVRNLAEVRVDEVIKGIQETGKYGEEEAVEVGCQVNSLIREICQAVSEGMRRDEEEDDDEDLIDEAWDDVRGGGLPIEKVVAARAEEVGFMEERGIWT